MFVTSSPPRFNSQWRLHSTAGVLLALRSHASLCYCCFYFFFDTIAWALDLPLVFDGSHHAMFTQWEPGAAPLEFVSVRSEGCGCPAVLQLQLLALNIPFVQDLNASYCNLRFRVFSTTSGRLLLIKICCHPWWLDGCLSGGRGLYHTSLCQNQAVLLLILCVLLILLAHIWLST